VRLHAVGGRDGARVSGYPLTSRDPPDPAALVVVRLNTTETVTMLALNCRIRHAIYSFAGYVRERSGKPATHFRGKD
jgi:hypothetical protein